MSNITITEENARSVLTQLLDNGRDRATIEDIAEAIGIQLEEPVTHTGTLRFELKSEFGISHRQVEQNAQRLLSNLPRGVELVSVQVESFDQV